MKEQEEEKEEAKEKESASSKSSSSSSSSSSGSDSEETKRRTFKISEKQKFLETSDDVEEFTKDELSDIPDEGFNRIVCSGNSYSGDACQMIEKIIDEKSSSDLYYADFSNMFVTRRETLPPSMRILIGAISNKPI